MSQVLMPKATAVWLVENTTLTFDQISAFTGLHPLEVQAIADGEVAGGMTGLDPTTNGQLTKEEIKRAEADPAARLKLSPRDVPMPVARSKGPRYTPVAKRQDRPDAIAWLLKIHPELQDSQVAKLVGSTKSTVQSVKDALVREGVPATAIAVIGRGEAGLLVKTADGVREPQNRRVEIVIQ